METSEQLRNMFNVNKKGTKINWCLSSVLFNFWTYFTNCSAVSIFDFEQVNARVFFNPFKVIVAIIEKSVHYRPN